jgi:GxxExxY protein
LECEFQDENILYCREKEYALFYKKRKLAHKFYADFVVLDNVILEIKATDEIADEDYAQVINYLKCSGCKVGLILNFGKNKLGVKRVIF